MPTNNGQRRRAVKAAKPKGNQVPYNDEMPRTTTRRLMNQLVRCSECGDRMLLKNLNAHVAKALLHKPDKSQPKRKTKAVPPVPGPVAGPIQSKLVLP
jgi:uncharacterized C2H2 Zn-finger protein